MRKLVMFLLLILLSQTAFALSCMYSQDYVMMFDGENATGYTVAPKKASTDMWFLSGNVGDGCADVLGYEVRDIERVLLNDFILPKVLLANLSTECRESAMYYSPPHPSYCEGELEDATGIYRMNGFADWSRRPLTISDEPDPALFASLREADERRARIGNYLRISSILLFMLIVLASICLPYYLNRDLSGRKLATSLVFKGALVVAVNEVGVLSPFSIMVVLTLLLSAVIELIAFFILSKRRKNDRVVGVTNGKPDR